MRLKQHLNELSSIYGKGITFLDIDDTIFHTFAKIGVVKDGKVIKRMGNQEFNTYKLKDGESFSFGEFRDADFFKKTSTPMNKTIKRIKRMFQNIDSRGSEVILLSARSNFTDMKEFKQVFKDVGLPIDKMKMELVGNFKENPDEYKDLINKIKGVENRSIAGRKEAVIMNYIEDGDYRRVRLVDDAISNIKAFLSIENKLTQSTIDKVKEKHKIEDGESIKPIEFYGLLVQSDGSLKHIK